MEESCEPAIPSSCRIEASQCLSALTKPRREKRQHKRLHATAQHEPSRYSRDRNSERQLLPRKSSKNLKWFTHRPSLDWRALLLPGYKPSAWERISSGLAKSLWRKT